MRLPQGDLGAVVCHVSFIFLQTDWAGLGKQDICVFKGSDFEGCDSCDGLPQRVSCNGLNAVLMLPGLLGRLMCKYD